MPKLVNKVKSSDLEINSDVDWNYKSLENINSITANIENISTALIGKLGMNLDCNGYSINNIKQINLSPTDNEYAILIDGLYLKHI